MFLVKEEQNKEEKTVVRFSTATQISGTQKLPISLPVRCGVFIARIFSFLLISTQCTAMSDLKGVTRHAHASVMPVGG
jgi:hypothetical protein